MRLPRGVGVRVTEEEYQRLRRLAEETGKSLSELIRLAIDHFLTHAELLDPELLASPLWRRILAAYETEAAMADGGGGE